ncbi:MAG: YbaB/EbfC family nucleoid-associated protein [Oscillospiraceae bacterium]|nr:YbaB/EbfC family nucleoid-associated protein [Oscillospiraceae bacterium]
MKSNIPKQFQGTQNMNSMIHQARKMQDQITAVQEDIEQRTFTASAGGGAVNVVVTGKKTLQSIELKPEVVDKDDIEMLQDLIISAVNEAINNVEETTENEMNKITGGVSLPGLF